MLPDLSGVNLLVWYWNDAAIDRATRIGAKALLVKAADGTTQWSQWNNDLIRAVAETGMDIYPWAYNYGDPAEIDALVGRGSRLPILDPEEEYEAQPADAQRAFVDAILAQKARGAITGCFSHCWYNPEAHPSYDYANLARAVDRWIPMVDFQDAGLTPTAAFDHWDASGVQAGKPTTPWISGNGIDGATLAGAVREARQRYGGVCIWEAMELTEDHLVSLARYSERATVTVAGDAPLPFDEPRGGVPSPSRSP